MSHNPNIRSVYEQSKEPTGFPNRTDSTISFDNNTGIFTIAPTADRFEYYIKGAKYIYTSPAQVFAASGEGIQHIYFDGYNLISSSTFTTEIITDYAYVANLYWSTTESRAIYLAEERHGITMDGRTHLYLHTSIGASYINGFALSDFQIDGTGNADADGYFSVADGAFNDEDISYNIINELPQSLYPIAALPVFYKYGVDSAWRKKDADAFPIIYSGTAGYVGASGRLPYNSWNGTTWDLTEVGNNNFVLLHIFATNDINHPVIAIQGTNEYATRALARSGATTELATLTGLPFAEVVVIGTVIFEVSNGYTNTIKARIISTDTGANYVDLRKISTLPVNQISDHGNLSGLSDPDHPASAIFTSTINFNGLLSTSNTTVQSALDALDNLNISQISPLTSKGDLLTRNASTHTKLSVGTDGYFLSADSLAPTGLSWRDVTAIGAVNKYLSNLEVTSINQSLLPNADNILSVGSSSLRWKDGYFGPTSLHIKSTTLETAVERNWSIALNYAGDLQIKESDQNKLTIRQDGYLEASNLLLSGNLKFENQSSIFEPSADGYGEIGTESNKFARVRSLTVAGNAVYNSIVKKYSSYSATVYDHTIICDAVSGSIDIYLPPAESSFISDLGQILYVKKIDSSPNTINIIANNLERIDGSGVLVLHAIYESITIQSDGLNWHII